MPRSWLCGVRSARTRLGQFSEDAAFLGSRATKFASSHASQQLTSRRAVAHFRNLETRRKTRQHSTTRCSRARQRCWKLWAAGQLEGSPTSGSGRRSSLKRAATQPDCSAGETDQRCRRHHSSDTCLLPPSLKIIIDLYTSDTMGNSSNPAHKAGVARSGSYPSPTDPCRRQHFSRFGRNTHQHPPTVAVSISNYMRRIRPHAFAVTFSTCGNQHWPTFSSSLVDS
ncbi:hypothetical protein L1887_49740 [Cichorium endivia]|nr:hypothetical protein L1887_49740 [Cichorium endivia]